MGELIRRYDWARSPLLAAEHWPLSLRTLVQMMLNSRFPMLIFWGAELITFYNDAFRPSLGNNGKHPSSLGQRGEQSWAESWAVIGPMIQDIMAGGQAVWFEDQKLPIYREGQMGYAYWTYSFSPLTDDSGAVGGVLVTCSETTKAVESQQRLLASEAFTQSLLDNSPVASMVFVGPEMVIRSSNEAMLEMLGRDNAILGLPFLEAMPELQTTPLGARLGRVLATGQPYHQPEERIELIRYGQPYTGYYHYIYSALPGPMGEFIGVIVTAIEVTQQVHARQAVEASETRFRALIDQSPAAIGLFVGRDLRIETANERMIQVWGKGSSVLGKSLREALPELEDQPFLDILQEVYTSGVAYTGQGERADLVIGGQRQTFYFNFTYQPIRDANGQVYAIMDLAIDVTAEVLLGQQVAHTQRALQSAVDLAQLGIWKIDLTTQAAEFSGLVCEWVGSPEPLTLQASVAAIDPADLPSFERAYGQALQPTSGGQLEVEYRLRNLRTGQVYLLHSMGQTEFDTQGYPVSMSGFSRDVTQLRATQLSLEHQVRQRTQELVLANQDLQRSNDNLQQFAYVASHDLQEPLRKIQSFSSLIAQQSGDQLDELTRNYLARITTAGARMSQLIKDLLMYSRVSTRQQTYSLVSLQAILSEVLVTLDWQIHQTRAQIQVDALPLVNGDSSQLSQLFQNLVSNALKFVEAGQTPQVQVRYAYRAVAELPAGVRPTKQSPYYHQISIRDEGVGFDTKYLDRIFQVFQRLHGKDAFPGTGVGLAICQRVVENHGGAITASGQVGGGATFCVYLPA